MIYLSLGWVHSTLLDNGRDRHPAGVSFDRISLELEHAQTSSSMSEEPWDTHNCKLLSLLRLF